MSQLPAFRIARGAACLALAALAALAVCVAGCSPDPLQKVRTLQAKGDWAATVEPLRALLDERPDDPEVHYRYGLALSGTGQGGMALWSFEKAMESPDWRVPAGLALAAALNGTRSYDEAARVCGRVLEADPKNTAALVLRAMAKVRSRRDYKGALADADHALEIDPDNVEAMAARGISLLALNRVDEASSVIDALDARFRDETVGLAGSARFCAVRASFAREKGDPGAAEKRYDECLEKFPTDSLVVDEAIEFFDRMGRGDRSIEILEAVLDKQPAAHSYRWALAQRLQADGKRDEALALLRAGTELDSPADAAQAWSSLAAFHAQAAEYDEAVDAFERALALVPKPSASELFTYADTLVLAGRYDKALEIADKMELPAHQEAVRGRVALARGEPAEALKHLGEANRLWPNNAAIRYYAAVAAEQVGDFDRAIEDYRYAIRIDPQATDAHLRLARMYMALGDNDKADTILSHQPGGRLSELESDLLQLRVLARLGRAKRLPPYLAQMASQPQNRGRAVAALAEGVHDRRGAAAAVETVLAAEKLDLTDPVNEAALEVLVEYLAEAGQSDEGLKRVQAALRAHPEAAVFHALRGRALALGGAPEPKIRAAYEGALERDPKEPRALLGLARLAAASGDAKSAADFYDRAIAADPHERAAVREDAAVLVTLGRRDEAEKRLEKLLREYPFDARAAIALAELRLDRGAERERTLELARRAVHFGGGPEAQALLERVKGSAAEPRTAGAG